MNELRLSFTAFVLAACALGGAATVHADEGGESGAAAAGAATQRLDFLDAAYLPGLERVVVSGLHGLIGLLEIKDGKGVLNLVDESSDHDFTALEKLSDTSALLGTSKGHLYRFDGKTTTEIASLSEYDEPILDIAVGEAGVWVVGARGLVAYSKDGETFEAVEIRDVAQPMTTFSGGQPADWYFGVSNVDPESFEFTAFVNGEPAVEEEHYIMFPDEGFVQFQTQLDMDPPPTVAFKFTPGPPFRVGDVSWNVVMLEGSTVTLAGEFGMVLQSTDNGETWVRRDSRFVPREPEPAYWLAGTQSGDTLWLTGAAGVSQRSSDRGVTWKDNPKPGREGIFGITLMSNGTPVIAGAVGLIGFLEDGKWKLADRTRLKLLSWLKTPVEMPDGTLLIMGGRATAIRYSDGEFQRVPVTF
ncbi:MAG: hypothetical protein RLW62_06985 [Gammaproteobacteria bacterium]